MLLDFLLAAALAVQATPLAQTVTAKLCDDPVTRNAVLARGTSAATVFADLKRRDQANGRRTDALLNRLAERGKLSREERGAAGLKMFASPVYQAAEAEVRGLFVAMLQGLERIAEGESAANCRIIVSVAASMPAMLAANDRQWRAMDAVLEAEAQALGISLAE